VISQIFSEDGSLLEDASPDAVLTIRQICYYAYKADLPYSSTEEDDVIDSFRRTETELRGLEIPNDAVIKMASLHIRELFGDYKFNPKLLKHGPGITSNVPLMKKWDHQLSPMPATERFKDFYFFNASDAEDRLSRYPVYSSYDFFHKGLERNATAKVILVPKDSRGPRLISCEPCENQWIQQAIASYMVNTIEESALVNFDVNFRDQTWNQKLALLGSEHGILSTLDLKDASDRNSLDLFNKVFALVPELRDDILACRSHATILPDGSRVELSKFAPMGSALCFPVMAITLWALIRAYFVGSGFNSPPQLKIYGDDIIVPSFMSHEISDLIERYGFRVNRAKSFSDSLFTESCGADCFAGKDVTPIKLRKIWNILDIENGHNKWVVPTIKHANLLQVCYPASAELLYCLAEFFTGPLPYGSLLSPFLCRLRNGADQEQTRKSLTALQVVPTFDVDPDTTGWGHYSRVRIGIGIGELDTRYGEYNLPRRWKIMRKKFKVPRLRAWGQI
jgi:hypothetical protein